MDKGEKIAEKGDQYAKRLWVRKKELNQSFESFSKSLRRRKKIMDAISKNELTPAAAAAAAAKPRNDKLANSDDDVEAEKSYVSTWPECVDNNLSAESCSAEPRRACNETCSVEKSLSPTDANFNNIGYPRSSSQFRRDFLAGLLHGANNAKSSPAKYEPKISLGEYFGAKSHKDMRTGNFLSKTCEEEFEHYNSEVKQIKAEQEYFHARVLEILEPEVVHVERKSSVDPSRRRVSDMTFIQEKFPTAPPLDADSTITSFVSEDVRELDREIEKLHLQPNVQVYAPETPKTTIYPNLASMERRMSDHCMKKLFQDDHDDVDAQTPDAKPTIQETFDNLPKPSLTMNETFSTPMPMTTTQMKKLDQQDQSTSMSFLKRNASFLFGNFHVPKIRRKPNMESTRKVNPLTPSQIGTTISTLTLPNTPSSPYTAEYYAAKSHQTQQTQSQETEGSVPVEVENFLKMALGDEYCNSTVYTNADMRNRSNSCINASELISEERTPCKNRIQPRMPMTEPPKHSSTLNRSLSIYRTLTKSIKRKFKRNVKEEPKVAQRCVLPDDLNPNLKDSVKGLLDLMEVYQTQIYQASKALDLCNSMREFQTSSERVELERLLIVSNLRKRSARDEIRRVTGKSVDKNLYCERGELTVKDLSLELRKDIVRRERQGTDCVEWFMIVVSEGLTVWATHAVACPLNGPRVYFPGKLSLPGLTPDFRLTVSVYSMQLHPILYNHEDKYHIHNRRDSDIHSQTCPSPQKFLHRNENKRKSVISPKQFEIRFSGIKESAFVLCAGVELTLYDLNLSSPWPLKGLSKDSVLHGTIDMDLNCRLQLSVYHAGFLTHGDEPGGLIAWSRRWCVLEGRSLLFWNYPREQECNKPPLYMIDLVDCVSRRVDQIDRSLCPRPRTLLVQSARRRCPDDEDSLVMDCRDSCTIVRNLLSCDTHQDLIEWQSKLNHVVSALREWNVIDTKSLQISDL